MKVNFFDKEIRNKFYAWLGGISTTAGIGFLFIDIDAKYKAGVGICTVILLVILYLGIWLHYNRLQEITLKINNSSIEVKFGDIFSEDASLKAIAFNEYFDTLVDEKVIASGSINGKYIEKLYSAGTSDLDSRISTDVHLAEKIVGENQERRVGKKMKYILGTIFVDNDYLLTAFSRFDGEDKAYLEINDYINCLLHFWNEVDRVYAGRTLALPVLGTGITRFKGYENISDQELLELIIWTFKVSRIKFTYPSKVKIVVWSEKSDKINLFKLKDLEE